MVMQSFFGLFGAKKVKLASPAELAAQQAAIAKTKAQIKVASQTQIANLRETEAAQLNAFLAQEITVERDKALAEFAVAVESPALRWQAAQAVQSPAGLFILLDKLAAKDRRIAKHVKDAQTRHTQAHDTAQAGLDYTARYASMAADLGIEVQAFVDLEHALEAKQKALAATPYPLPQTVLDAIAPHRAAIRALLDRQNQIQRRLSAMRVQLQVWQQSTATLDSAGLETAVAEHTATASEWDAMQTEPAYIHALHVLPIKRLHNDVNTLVSPVGAALQAAQDRIKHAQVTQEAQESAAEKAARLAAKTAQNAEKDAAKRAQFATFIATAQPELANALAAGHGAEAVKLAKEIRYQLHYLRADSALEAMLVQAEQIADVVYEGYARQREALIARAQALADTPLLPQYQEAAILEAQAAWKTLAHNAGLANQEAFLAFKTACNAAYEVVKAHKKNVNTLRSMGVAQRQAHLNELTSLVTQIDWATVDYRAVEQLRRESRTAWRAAPPTAQKEYVRLATEHETIMTLLSDKITAHRDALATKREEQAAYYAAQDAKRAAKAEEIAEMRAARAQAEKIAAEKTAAHKAVQDGMQARAQALWDAVLSATEESAREENKALAWAACEKDKATRAAFAVHFAAVPAMYDAKVLNEVMLDAEIVFGVQSPADYADARLKRQVQRLAGKLKGTVNAVNTGKMANTGDAISENFAAWLAVIPHLNPADEAACTRFAALQ